MRFSTLNKIKLPITFVVNETFSLVTPESAEHGEVADSGFESEGDCYTMDELASLIEDRGFIHPSSSHPSTKRDWITTEPVQDSAYFTHGEERSFSLHLVDVKDADGKSLPEEMQNKFWVALIAGKERARDLQVNEPGL